MISINNLLSIMSHLRDPKTGCPWDLQQDFNSIAPYTIEEAYEVVDAIERQDMDELKHELGDLLFQVVFHAQIAKELGLFAFDDIVQSISDKLVRRHPHVFGDTQVLSAEEQAVAWITHKQKERAQKKSGEENSILDGITVGLPAITRAVKLQERTAQVGFDWPQIEPVLDKVAEELAETKHAIVNEQSEEKITEEVGDLLFSVINVARHAGIDPESALRRSNAKFERRFKAVELQVTARGLTMGQVSSDELEDIYQLIKASENSFK